MLNPHLLRRFIQNGLNAQHANDRLEKLAHFNVDQLIDACTDLFGYGEDDFRLANEAGDKDRRMYWDEIVEMLTPAQQERVIEYTR